MAHWIYSLDLFGTAVFAISGAMAAGRKSMDIFGVVVLAMDTALGGGTLRDVIISRQEVFWILDSVYIFVALSAGVLTFATARIVRLPREVLIITDALGLATFTVIGAQRAIESGAGATAAVIMGVMTGVVGGMMRDLLVGQIPLVLRKEIYATASLVGAVTFVLMNRFLTISAAGMIVPIIIVIAIRLATIRWNLSLPVFRMDARQEEHPSTPTRTPHRVDSSGEE